MADLSLPVAFLYVVAHEIIAVKNWRNLPMRVALSLLLMGNLLVPLDAIGVAATADIGNRIGLATLLMLISLGRWPDHSELYAKLAYEKSTRGQPAASRKPSRSCDSRCDRACARRLDVPSRRRRDGLGHDCRWERHQLADVSLPGPQEHESLLLILHVGYGWLAAGLLLFGVNEERVMHDAVARNLSRIIEDDRLNAPRDLIPDYPRPTLFYDQSLPLDCST